MVAQLGKEHNKPIALTEGGMGGLGNRMVHPDIAERTREPAGYLCPGMA